MATRSSDGRFWRGSGRTRRIWAHTGRSSAVVRRRRHVRAVVGDWRSRVLPTRSRHPSLRSARATDEALLPPVVLLARRVTRRARQTPARGGAIFARRPPLIVGIALRAASIQCAGSSAAASLRGPSRTSSHGGILPASFTASTSIQLEKRSVLPSCLLRPREPAANDRRGGVVQLPATPSRPIS